MEGKIECLNLLCEKDLILRWSNLGLCYECDNCGNSYSIMTMQYYLDKDRSEKIGELSFKKEIDIDQTIMELKERIKFITDKYKIEIQPYIDKIIQLENLRISIRFIKFK